MGSVAAASVAMLLCCNVGSADAAAVVTTATYINNEGAVQTWNNGANWSSNPDWPSGTGAGAIFNGPNAARTVNLVEAITVGGLSFNNDTSFAATVGNGGGSLTFDAVGAGPATVTVEGFGSGNTTLSATSSIADSVVATVTQTSQTSQAGGLNWTGAISGGDGSFTKQGPGILTFGTNAKRYTGPTLLDTDSGRTRISVAGSPQSTSSFTVNPGAQITLITQGTYTLGAGSLILNGTGLGFSSYPGDFPGAIRNNTNLVATITNPVVLQSDTLIHVQGADTGSTTFANAVSGPGHLTLTAPNSNADLGRLVLSGANTYTGGTTVRGGTVFVGDPTAATANPTASLGTGDVLVESGAFVFSGATARLTLQTGVLDAIADTATLTLLGGSNFGVADDGFAELGEGVNEVVGSLVLGFEPQFAGTYGSSSSPAEFKNDEYFAGTGMITVIPEPGAVTMLLGAFTVLLCVQRFRRRS